MGNKNLCVFLGSSSGHNPIYKEKVIQLGKFIAHENYNLIYGGSNIGLMGLLADTILQEKGSVYGVTPTVIKEKEFQHTNLTKLYEVETMHERKAKMYEMSNAFLAFPGGMGTLDEFCEITTWMQLEYHKKPLGLLNINGFFNPFIKMVDHITSEGFFGDKEREKIKVLNEIHEIKDFLA